MGIAHIAFTSKQILPWRRLKVSILSVLKDFLRCPQLKQRAWQRLASSILEVFGRNVKVGFRHVRCLWHVGYAFMVQKLYECFADVLAHQSGKKLDLSDAQR